MDSLQKDEIIKLRLGQAYEALSEAEILFRHGAYPGTFNRIYYAMFYAVQALAVKFDFKTSKHGQLIGWFNKEFIKTGLMEPRLFELLRTAFDRRSDADYQVVRVEPVEEEVAQMLTDLRAFIVQIETFLRK